MRAAAVRTGHCMDLRFMGFQTAFTGCYVLIIGFNVP